MHNGPKITVIYNLLLNSPVLVWRKGLTGQLLVNIRFIYHVHEARDLHETRICTINTALEKN